jgi:hypothetical protein
MFELSEVILLYCAINKIVMKMLHSRAWDNVISETQLSVPG